MFRERKIEIETKTKKRRGREGLRSHKEQELEFFPRRVATKKTLGFWKYMKEECQAIRF